MSIFYIIVQNESYNLVDSLKTDMNEKKVIPEDLILCGMTMAEDSEFLEKVLTEMTIQNINVTNFLNNYNDFNQLYHISYAVDNTIIVPSLSYYNPYFNFPKNIKKFFTKCISNFNEVFPDISFKILKQTDGWELIVINKYFDNLEHELQTHMMYSDLERSRIMCNNSDNISNKLIELADKRNSEITRIFNKIKNIQSLLLMPELQDAPI